MSHRRAKKIRGELFEPGLVKAETGMSRGALIRDLTKYTTYVPYVTGQINNRGGVCNPHNRRVLMVVPDCPRGVLKRRKRYGSW